MHYVRLFSYIWIMGRKYIRVHSWSENPNGGLNVSYSSWDGKCLCTAVGHEDTFMIIEGTDVALLTKQDVTKIVFTKENS